MFLYQNPKALPRARLNDGRSSGSVTDSAPTRVRLEVAGPSAGAIVLADQWYPGWQARGASRPWNTARPTRDHSITGDVPAGPTGRHPAGEAVLEMRYLPATFRVGLYGLCLALAAAVGIAVGELTRRSGGRRGG